MTISINAQKVITRSYVRPQTLGQQPVARYQHAMEYYRGSNVIIIAGGRNDQLHNERVLNDVWILKVNNLEWQ
jgi:Rab9 effector protein with kelch motifs